MNFVGEIRDPVHGYIYFTELEKKLIDTPPVQRLHRIHQLAGASLTYPGAEHSRFSHSLGSMHLAGRMASRFQSLGYLNEDDCQKARVAGLLHDVGHGPFSHNYEDILNKYRNLTHEDLAQWLIRESEIKDVLNEHGYSPDEISKLSVGKLGKTFLDQVIASQMDVDIMDYLVRDSYFAGVEYGRVDIHRLIDSVDVVDNSLAMDVTALYALEAFVIARYESFKALYFHRSVRAAGVMLIRAMDFANDRIGLTSFKSPEDYLCLDDWSVLHSILSLKDEKARKLKVAYDLAHSFCDRKLLKCAYEIIIHHRDAFFTSLFAKEEIRQQIVKEISQKAGVDPDYLIIDVPTVPSVPYYPAQRHPADIPVFQTLPDGSKQVGRLSQFSHIIDTLIGYMDVIRVYSPAEVRDKVRDAVSQIFGGELPATRISF